MKDKFPKILKSEDLKEPWVEAFKTGEVVDMAGKSHNFSEADLNDLNEGIHNQLAAGYQPPMVKGHPKVDDPRVASIVDSKVEDNVLKVKLDDVSPDFADEVKKGGFKYISAAIYSNLKKGLRHLGALGAHAPAMKGMAPLCFGEGMFAESDKGSTEQDVCVFAEPFAWDRLVPRTAFESLVYKLSGIGRMFRSQREQLIEKDGIEAADKVFPEYDVRMKFFEAAGDGSVDISSACDGAAMILHAGDQASTAKETLTITGCNPAMGRCPGFITVVPRGAAYELDVVLPCTAASTETITLHAGCAGIFTFQYNNGNVSWKCFETNRSDCPAFFKEISVDGIIHVLNGNDTFDIKCDMNSANAWIPELVVGDLDTYMIVSVPKLHVYKQSTFEKDVTIKADAVIEKTLTVNKSIDAGENIRTPFFVIGRNVPGALTSIGDPESGTATYLQWQLKSAWEMNEVKKIFNDTGATVEQAVFVPDSLPRLGQPAITSRLNTIYIPARTYREFTCVGSHTQNGVEYAVLAPSSDQ